MQQCHLEIMSAKWCAEVCMTKISVSPYGDTKVVLFVTIIAFVFCVLHHLRNNQKDIVSVQQEMQEDYDEIVQLVEQILNMNEGSHCFLCLMTTCKECIWDEIKDNIMHAGNVAIMAKKQKVKPPFQLFTKLQGMLHTSNTSLLWVDGFQAWVTFVFQNVLKPKSNLTSPVMVCLLATKLELAIQTMINKIW